jgi:ABC-type phosphate/phosphonate transport system substrate-binding protein
MFLSSYLEEQFNKKKDPLEDFLDDLFYEVVFEGSTDAAREAVLELADMYVMNSSIFDYLIVITDEIIREEAASVVSVCLLCV